MSCDDRRCGADPMTKQKKCEQGVVQILIFLNFYKNLRLNLGFLVLTIQTATLRMIPKTGFLWPPGLFSNASNPSNNGCWRKSGVNEVKGNKLFGEHFWLLIQRNAFTSIAVSRPTHTYGAEVMRGACKNDSSRLVYKSVISMNLLDLLREKAPHVFTDGLAFHIIHGMIDILPPSPSNAEKSN